MRKNVCHHIPRITTNQGMYNIRSQGTKPMNTGKHYYFVLLKSTSKLLRQWVPTFLLALQSYMKKFYLRSCIVGLHDVPLISHQGLISYLRVETALRFPGSTKISNSRHSVIFREIKICLLFYLSVFSKLPYLQLLYSCVSSVFSPLRVSKKLEPTECQQNFWWCKNYKVLFSSLHCPAQVILIIQYTTSVTFTKMQPKTLVT